MKIFSRQTIFFCIVVCENIFSGVIFLQTIFFMPAKNLVVLFLLLQTNFSGFFKTNLETKEGFVISKDL